MGFFFQITAFLRFFKKTQIGTQYMGSKRIDISTRYSHKFYEDLKLD